MSVATLAEALTPALQEGYALAGLVVLGWEDAVCYTEAGNQAGLPIILQAGPGCRRHTPLPVLGKMFRHLAETVNVPVVCHLDHGNTLEEVRIAIDCGFSSVMFDGSKLPLIDNIKQTAKAAQLAHDAGVSIEGEIGYVGYDDGAISNPTVPEEARQIAKEAGLDALAVSIGNTHLQTEQKAEIDLDQLSAIEQATPVPLVIHGGSGVPADIRKNLAHNSHICKFNIGTETRQLFGAGVKQYLTDHPNVFDRLEILQAQMPALTAATKQIIQNFGPAKT